MATNFQKIKFKLDTAPLKELEKQLANTEAFLKAKNTVIGRVCRNIQPLVRRLLLDALRKSGLHLNRELEKWVGQSIVYPTTQGIKIGPPRGLGEDAYKKMGALQYGYMKGLGVTKAKVRSKIKQAQEKHYQATGNANGPKGSKLIQPHPYYQLEDSQIKLIELAINQQMQREYEHFMRTQK